MFLFRFAFQDPPALPTAECIRIECFARFSICNRFYEFVVVASERALAKLQTDFDYIYILCGNMPHTADCVACNRTNRREQSRISSSTDWVRSIFIWMNRYIIVSDCAAQMDGKAISPPRPSSAKRRKKTIFHLSSSFIMITLHVIMILICFFAKIFCSFVWLFVSVCLSPSSLQTMHHFSQKWWKTHKSASPGNEHRISTQNS